MKKRLFVFMVLLCLGVACAYAEGGLTVTHKNFMEFDGKDRACFFARIENTGNTAVAAGTGKLVGFSTKDDILVSDNYVSSNPSYIMLNPGEYIYARSFIYEKALESADVVDYKFSMETQENGDTVERIPSEAAFTYNSADEYDNYVNVTLTNNSDKVMYKFYVTVALYDDNGALLLVDGTSYDQLGVHPNSTVTLKFNIGSEMVNYFNTHSLIPTKADAVVVQIKE